MKYFDIAYGAIVCRDDGFEGSSHLVEFLIESESSIIYGIDEANNLYELSYNKIVKYKITGICTCGHKEDITEHVHLEISEGGYLSYYVHDDVVEKIDKPLSIKDLFSIGNRVEGVFFSDHKFSYMKGKLGTIRFVGDIDNILIEWDNGVIMTVIFGKDIIRRLD